MKNKLLLMFVALNCVVVQASELHDALRGENQKKECVQPAEKYPGLAHALAEQERLLHQAECIEKELSEYELEQQYLYNKALVDELFGISNALAELHARNEHQYSQEEKESSMSQDDSSRGYFFGHPATTNSRNGMILSYFFMRKQHKAGINDDLKHKFESQKDKFNTVVIPAFKTEVEHKFYELNETYQRSIENCGLNEECLLENGVVLPAILQPTFFANFNRAAIKAAIELTKKENIPLTEDEVSKIVNQKIFEIHNGKKISVQSLEDAKKKIENDLEGLLYPEKRYETVFGNDLKEDQNDQGALST